MNILILGGNGYLGSKLTKALVAENQHNITCTIRTTSNISRIKEHIGKELLTIPASLDAVETAMKFVPFDIVFNMACSYGRQSTLFSNVIEANIDFPLHVLNCVVEKGCKKYITIGSGLPDDLNMYSFSKKMFSEFGKYYAEHHEIDFFNLKLQMFYGADEPKDRFIPLLIQKMLDGQEVNVTIGTQHRDIVSAADILKAILAVFHSNLHGYQEIPVGTGIAPTISELVDFIWEETGKKSQINRGAIPMREREPDCVADTTMLRSLTNWAPIDWQCGIKTMIDEMRMQR